MSIIKIGTRVAALCASLVMAGAAWAADTYPDHKIRMIVPFAAGGPTDVIGRLVAERLSEVLGQQVYVENLPGAGGNLGVETAKRAAPDGYTIVVVLDRLHHQSDHVHDHRLRSAQGFCADLPGRGIAQRDHRAPFRAGEKPQRADRFHQGQSRQIQLRPAKHRLGPRTLSPSR